MSDDSDRAIGDFDTLGDFDKQREEAVADERLAACKEVLVELMPLFKAYCVQVPESKDKRAIAYEAIEQAKNDLGMNLIRGGRRVGYATVCDLSGDVLYAVFFKLENTVFSNDGDLISEDPGEIDCHIVEDEVEDEDEEADND